MILDTLMFISGMVLLILFIFLVFTNIIIIISFFKRQKKIAFEPKISIIVPAYNEAENIVQCINSITRSGYPKDKYEIIVVDDGSTDGTAAIASSLSKGKILVIYGKHKGKAEALNLGFKKAKHEYIVTIDADTLIEPHALSRLVEPLADDAVGGTTGTYKVKRSYSLLKSFQRIEYAYNNLVSKGFSKTFNNGIWFFGAIACYKRSVLKKIGYIASDTLTEDMDVQLRIQKAGYKTIHAYDALAYTKVPSTFKGFFKQRIRWWTGILQAMQKNKAVVRKNPSMPLYFVYISQWWWTIFGIIAIPMFIMQILYWLPSNMATLWDTFYYLFRWFSLLGPVYVIVMIKQWGISIYSFFGVLSGILSVTFISIAVRTFKEKIGLWDMLAIFFYFPYTLLLNMIIFISFIKYTFSKHGKFMK